MGLSGCSDGLLAGKAALHSIIMRADGTSVRSCTVRQRPVRAVTVLGNGERKSVDGYDKNTAGGWIITGY